MKEKKPRIEEIRRIVQEILFFLKTMGLNKRTSVFLVNEYIKQRFDTDILDMMEININTIENK